MTMSLEFNSVIIPWKLIEDSTVALPSKTEQYLLFLKEPLQFVFPLKYILLYTEFIRK